MEPAPPLPPEPPPQSPPLPSEPPLPQDPPPLPPDPPPLPPEAPPEPNEPAPPDKASGDASPSKAAKPATGGFMPASLRMKRPVPKPKAKLRRGNSEQDIAGARAEANAEAKQDVEMAAPVVAEPPKPLLPPLSRQKHTLPARECRSADDFYNNLKPVQEGRHGVVYRARCKDSGETVALKNMKNPKDSNPGRECLILVE